MRISIFLNSEKNQNQFGNYSSLNLNTKSMKNIRILITGSNGLLGQKLVKQCQQQGLHFLATSNGENRNPDCPDERYKTLDITSGTEVETVLNAYHPTHVINTAAMTNVDQCEVEEDACHKINVEAVKYLFGWSKNNNCHFQHLSTDFVFDGEKGNYVETDEVNPLSTYAKSKVASELILRASNYENWSIVRTIIVFGTGHSLSRSNIVLWGREAVLEDKQLTIVDDQFRAPTWAEDLAKGCLLIVTKQQQGIFHISGPETCSVIEWVKRIARFYKQDESKITAISSKTLNQKAKRPPKTGFNLIKAYTLLGYSPLTFEQALAELENEL